MYGCHFVVCWIYFVFLGLVFFNTSDWLNTNELLQSNTIFF
jgi:hypothetical protein